MITSTPYCMPQERLKGHFSRCMVLQLDYFRSLKRENVYGSANVLNSSSLRAHFCLGFKQCGETFCIVIAYISRCYYESWPYPTRKVHCFLRRRAEKQDWV
jgi:hypothetical protein